MSSPKQRGIEARWGLPFWQLVREFAEQDLTRNDTARALGYNTQAFHQLLARNPRLDPFEPYGVLRALGEPLRDVVLRMAPRFTVTQTARAVGYAGDKPVHRFRQVLRRFGLGDIQFARGV